MLPFLQQEDCVGLLGLAHDVREAVGPAITSLGLHGSVGYGHCQPEALLRLLQRLPRLRYLSVVPGLVPGAQDMTRRESQLVVDAIGSGSVGGQLRGLRLRFLGDDVAYELLACPASPRWSCSRRSQSPSRSAGRSPTRSWRGTRAACHC